MSSRLSTIAVALALACAAETRVWAQPTTAAPTGPNAGVAVATKGANWVELTTNQRKALAPLERDWASIDPSRRSKWLEIAARFPSMPADEQKRIQGRMTEWARLSPAERGQARLSFQEAKQLTPQERQARWEAYQALPDSERKALAAKASASAARPSSTSLSTAKTTAGAARPVAPLMHAVAPTIVQAKPGATTTSMAKGATPPAHQVPGQPKIAAKPSQVDRTTLLPRKPASADAGPAAASAPKPRS